MIKLLTLKAKQFFAGIALSAHSLDGIFKDAIGLNPFILTEPGNSDTGLIQAAASPTNLDSGGLVVIDAPIAGESRVTGASTGKVYILGDLGHFYSLDLLTMILDGDLRSGTPITNPATGLFLFTAAGGAEKVYYIQKTQIGQWDISGTYPTGWSDNWATGLQSTTIHQRHRFGDRVYITDKDRISMVYDNAGTPTLSLNVLDFPTGYINTCINDDGNYLVAAITRNQGDNSLYADTKVVFWDTYSPSWNMEYSIPDPCIISMQRVGSSIIATGAYGLWVFSLSSPPRNLRRMLGSAYGYPNSTGLLGDAIIWGVSTYINSYGKMAPNVPNAFFRPFAGYDSANKTLIMTLAKIRLFLVGTAGNKLYSTSLVAGGGAAAPETIFFDLGAEYQIGYIEVVFGTPLASGDSVSFALNDGQSSVTWGSSSFTLDGALKKKRITADNDISVIAEELSITISYIAGNVKIKKITVYGTPTGQ